MNRPRSEHEDDDRDGRRPNLRQVRPRDLAHLGHHAVIEIDEARADARAIARAAGAAGGSGTSDRVSHYLVSLWTRCLLQRGQYFFHSTRSGCRRLFFVVK